MSEEQVYYPGQIVKLKGNGKLYVVESSRSGQVFLKVLGGPTLESPFSKSGMETATFEDITNYRIAEALEKLTAYITRK